MPYQSNVDFHAESIGAVYLVETPMLGGNFNGKVKKML
jgi:hypothetical protein